MPGADSGAALQIGDWLVNPSTDSIAHGEEVQKLEPRTMRLLLQLAESPGAVVSVDRMLTEVWAGVIVSPASVYQAVSRLRRLLRDTDPNPTYIATVPRKGYRLIAPVRRIELPPAGAAPPRGAAPTRDRAPSQGEAPPSGEAAPPRRRWRAGTVAGLAALAVMAVAVMAWFQMRKGGTPSLEAPSIVVLPFRDMTVEQHDQAFCDGLTEELSNWLAQIPTLRVVARTSAFAYQGKDIDVRKIGRELGTSHVLEGSLRRSGALLRVIAQLVSTRDGYHVWSATFDLPVDDVVKVQEEIAHAVADNLEIRLTDRALQHLAARRGGNPQAYQLYLLARHHARQLTRDSNSHAIELYQQAISLDDHFALAYALLAHAYANQSYLDGLPVDDVARKAEPLLATAMSLNPALPEVYMVRGGLRGDQGRYDEALADLSRAIALNPNDSLSISERGYVLLTNGRPRDALASYDAAVALDPLDFNLHARRCNALTDMARFDEADLACTRARALAAAGTWAYVATSWLEWARGRIDEALKWNALALRSSPNELDLYDDRVSLLLMVGRAAEAQDTLERARSAVGNKERIAARLAQVSYYEGGEAALRAQLQATRLDSSTSANTWFYLARLKLILGDVQGASELLDTAVAASDSSLGTLDLQPWPWYERQGESNDLILAMVKLRLGDHSSAVQRLDALLGRLERLRQAGVERYGLYTLRGEALALRGDLEGSMAALDRAAALGWRAATEAQHNPAFAALQSRNDFHLLLQRMQQQDLQMQRNIATR
jgi:TolB-like protein/DNA-binding winged helix-turn-helix (wHTH) protein/Tfp pilus assembly protein PilF